MLNKKGGISFLSLFFLTALINCAEAAVIYVHPGESIQTAINQAVSGDTVFLCNGSYSENIAMKDGVDVIGETTRSVIIKGNVFFKDAATTLRYITVLFTETAAPSYTGTYYSNLALPADAGITAVNSVPAIQNCIIKPDLDTINAERLPFPPLEYYGTAIQIWNMYGNSDISPDIKNNLIEDAENAVFYFSQAFGGAINGNINNNTFHHNKSGIILRMHKENPHIYNNIFSGSENSAVSFMYEDGDLFTSRKSNINNNIFNENAANFWLDSAQSEFDLIGENSNIEADPLFTDPVNDDFHLDPSSPAAAAGDDGSYAGAYAAVSPGRIYVYLSGQRIASEDDTGKYFYHNDHLGGANVITDGAAQIVKAVEYWPYGGTKEESGFKDEKRLFTGKEFDSETGLYFYGARYYDSAICRFISADSVIPSYSNPQALNRYAYCFNNPVNLIDPTGNSAEAVKETIGAIKDYVDYKQKPSFKTVIKILIGHIPFIGDAMGVLDTIADTKTVAGLKWDEYNLNLQTAKTYKEVGKLYDYINEKNLKNREIDFSNIKDLESQKRWYINAGGEEDKTLSAGDDIKLYNIEVQFAQISGVQQNSSGGGGYHISASSGDVYNIMEHYPQSSWSSIQREYQAGMTWTSYDRQAYSQGYKGITRPVQGAGGAWKSQTSYFGHAIHPSLDRWTTDSTP